MTHESDRFSLSFTCVVLGDNGEITSIAVSDRFFTDLASKLGGFKGKQLVSHFTFDKDWNTWEMHRVGEEFVYLLSGRVDLILEQNRTENTVHAIILLSSIRERQEAGGRRQEEKKVFGLPSRLFHLNIKPQLNQRF